jgi:hypothetical protein
MLIEASKPSRKWGQKGPPLLEKYDIDVYAARKNEDWPTTRGGGPSKVGSRLSS